MLETNSEKVLLKQDIQSTGGRIREQFETKQGSSAGDKFRKQIHKRAQNGVDVGDEF